MIPWSRTKPPRTWIICHLNGQTRIYGTPENISNNEGHSLKITDDSKMPCGEYGQSRGKGCRIFHRDWSNGTNLLRLRNLDDSRAHISYLVRDKATDITWVFGPLKRHAGLQSFLSHSQLRPGEPASVPFPRADLCQKKSDFNAPSSILLPPKPSLICNPPKKKVCLE